MDIQPTPSPTRPAPTALTAALKEWRVAVQALAQGETILLLRKGGIRESGGRFAVPQRQVWLYPTDEHQKPHLLKPPYAERVQPVESGWHPEAIPLVAWAEITHVLPVQEADVVRSLLPFHIWNEAFVTERLQWKPKSPLWLLLLRVYRLSQTQVIPFIASYGGCKSWIELEPSIAIAGSVAVFTDAEYGDRVREIQARLT